MRVLITGAGLVGVHAAASLQAGHEVVLCDVAPDERFVRSVVGSHIPVLHCDVTDPASLGRVMTGVHVVVHTAGLIGPVAQARPHDAFVVNVLGTLEVAEAARLAGVTRLIHASTHGVYDFDSATDQLMHEGTPTEARSVYAASKLAAEHVLQGYAGAYGMSVVALRFCDLFGRGRYVAGSRGGEAFHALIAGVIRGEPGPVAAPLAGRREWLYAKDAGSAVAAAVVAAGPSGFAVVNIGSGTLTGPDELARAIRKVVPDARFVMTGAPGRVRRQPFDLSLAQRMLQWVPTYTLDAAVADYIVDVRSIGA